jgi:hypothetical protein
LALNFLRHLRQLPNGETGQLQVVEAVFSRRAIHDQIVRNFTHAVEIANLALKVRNASE